MKLSPLLCASLVALLAFTLTAKGEVSFTFHKINWDYRAGPVYTPDDCKKDGGEIIKKNGDGACKIPSVTARTDSNRGVWKAPAGCDSKTAKEAGNREREVALGGPDTATRTKDKGTGDRTQQGRVQLDADQNEASEHCDNGKGKAVKDSKESEPAASRTETRGETDTGLPADKSEWKYVPVRRLASYLEESLYRETKWVVFEPNDEPLWAKIRLKVGAYMMSLYRQGAFQGATPKDAFYVKCDRSTTTQDDIDHGVVNIVIGFAPLKPAEFVVIKIRQHTSKEKQD